MDTMNLYTAFRTAGRCWQFNAAVGRPTGFESEREAQDAADKHLNEDLAECRNPKTKGMIIWMMREILETYPPGMTANSNPWPRLNPVRNTPLIGGEASDSATSSKPLPKMHTIKANLTKSSRRFRCKMCGEKCRSCEQDRGKRDMCRPCEQRYKYEND